MENRLAQQAAEIQSLLRESGLSPEEMAVRVAIKPDTLRKIMKGYQPASDHVMDLIRRTASRRDSEPEQSARVQETPDEPARPLRDLAASLTARMPPHLLIENLRSL